MTNKIKEVTVIPQENEATALIAQAIDKNLPVETMEKLFALREKVKAEMAKEAFVRAMGEFQKNCPVIKKTKRVLNKDGQSVRYQYASIDSIVDQIKNPLADAGLSYRWETKQDKGSVTAICFVTHSLGHTESSDFTVEIDASSFMTSPQRSASALTFSKRYSMCNALGISTADEDTDATDVNKEKAPKSDKAKIVFLLRSLGYEATKKTDAQNVIKKATGLDLEESNYPEIVARLEVILQEKNESN